MTVFLAAVAVILTDQASKYVIARHMALHESVPVIPGFFHITYILNKGAVSYTHLTLPTIRLV